MNEKRNIVKIINDVCTENKIKVDSYSYDWIFKLQKKEINKFIFGYQFDLNSSSTNALINDKSGMFEIMNNVGIPSVEHYFYMNPINICYKIKDSVYSNILSLLEKNKKLVLKPNCGSGGLDVVLVDNVYDLEKQFLYLFSKHTSIAVSPYYEISGEYRFVVLDNEIKLAYKKIKPCVIGDGKSDLNLLISNYMSQVKNSNKIDCEIFSSYENKILELGEVFYLSWKHNLGKGANPSIIELKDINLEIINIIQKVVKEFNIRFASIDIVDTFDGYKILEINSGVMLENFSSYSKENYDIAKKIYTDAILKMFENEM